MSILFATPFSSSSSSFGWSRQSQQQPQQQKPQPQRIQKQRKFYIICTLISCSILSTTITSSSSSNLFTFLPYDSSSKENNYSTTTPTTTTTSVDDSKNHTTTYPNPNPIVTDPTRISPPSPSSPFLPPPRIQKEQPQQQQRQTNPTAPFTSTTTSYTSSSSIPQQPQPPQIKYIFGHSTGHSGSTTTQKVLVDAKHCPWSSSSSLSSSTLSSSSSSNKPQKLVAINLFEKHLLKEWTSNWKWYNNTTTYTTTTTSNNQYYKNYNCHRVEMELLPFLTQKATELFQKEKEEHLHPHSHSQKQQTSSLKEDDINFLYMDLGHFHNRGRILECFAQLLGPNVAFIKLRRNRYDIAYSFTNPTPSKKSKTKTKTTTKLPTTPCYATPLPYPKIKNDRRRRRPVHGLCPHSHEIGTPTFAGNVNLPLPTTTTTTSNRSRSNDAMWTYQFTTFQRFLWYVDEMEHRWYTLQQQYPRYSSSTTTTTSTSTNNTNPTIIGPLYLEVTWSTSEELQSGLQTILQQLGCRQQQTQGLKQQQQQQQQQPSKSNTKIGMVNWKKHVQHKPKSRNCSWEIVQDIQYQYEYMNYTSTIRNILYNKKYPQHVDSTDCMDTYDELQSTISHIIQKQKQKRNNQKNKKKHEEEEEEYEEEEFEQHWILPPKTKT